MNSHNSVSVLMNVSRIEGDLKIRVNGNFFLSPLRFLKEITGDLTVEALPDQAQAAEEVDLSGLNALQNIGGDFVIYVTQSLSSLQWLPKLQLIDGSFLVGRINHFTIF